MRYQIELPLPPKTSSPNYKPMSRGGRMLKAKQTREYRDACAWMYMEAKAKGELPAEFTCFPICLHLEFYLGRADIGIDQFYYPRDSDNACGSAKALQDALMDAKMLPHGDGARYVTQGSVRLYSTAKEHKGRMCVVLTIEEGEG